MAEVGGAMWFKLCALTVLLAQPADKALAHRKSAGRQFAPCFASARSNPRPKDVLPLADLPKQMRQTCFRIGEISSSTNWLKHVPKCASRGATLRLQVCAPSYFSLACVVYEKYCNSIYRFLRPPRRLNTPPRPPPCRAFDIRPVRERHLREINRRPCLRRP